MATKKPLSLRYFSLLFLVTAYTTQTISEPISSDWQIQRERELNLQNQKNIPKAPDIQIDTSTLKNNNTNEKIQDNLTEDNKLQNESLCFEINNIELITSHKDEFVPSLLQTLNTLNIQDKVNVENKDNSIGDKINSSDKICVGEHGSDNFEWAYGSSQYTIN